MSAFYLYNEDGNASEATTYDSEGEFDSLFKFDYDYRGIRSHVTMLSQGKMPTGRDYTDAQNLKIKLEQCNYGITKEDEFMGKGGAKVKETATYDRNGELIERMRRAPDGSYSRTLFEYDDRGRCISEKDIRDGELFTTTRYQYKVNAVGNWISRLAIVNLGEGYEWVPLKL